MNNNHESISGPPPCPKRCELCNYDPDSWEDFARHVSWQHAKISCACPCGFAPDKSVSSWEPEAAHLQSQPDLWRHLRGDDRQTIAVAGGTAVVDSEGRVESWTQSGTLPGSEPVVLVSQPGHGPTIVGGKVESPTIDDFRRRVVDMTTLLQQHADKLSGMYSQARVEGNEARIERNEAVKQRDAALAELSSVGARFNETLMELYRVDRRVANLRKGTRALLEVYRNVRAEIEKVESALKASQKLGVFQRNEILKLSADIQVHVVENEMTKNKFDALRTEYHKQQHELEEARKCIRYEEEREVIKENRPWWRRWLANVFTK